MEESAQLPVVCLGASAGGLEALDEFFGAIPVDTGAAFVVVVHLSPDFKSLMPELLAKRTKMPVEPATDGTPLEANHVYIIPPSTNMSVDQLTLRLQAQDRTPGHALNLPIDLFLSSMAEHVGPAGIAVILSGTGSDGSKGLRRLKEAGGVALAQTPTSAKFDGMPLSATLTGLVDAEGSPAELTKKITTLLEHDFHLNWAEDAEAGERPSSDLEEVTKLVARKGLNVSYFRPAMVARRIRRRMTLTGARDIEAYIAFLKKNDDEVSQLGSDLLIGVTEFFRDKHAFARLSQHDVPKLLLQIPAGEQLRVWVTACSTGQEAYSIVMLLLDAMEAAGIERDLKVFATDVDERALARASRGMYSLSEVADIPPGTLSRYFEQVEGMFIVRPAVRKAVIFARHNVVSDAPFTRMDLVTCRNLLIYLRPEAQRQVLNSLFTAMKPDRGLLLLGEAENVGALEKSLPAVDKKAKIFSRGSAQPEHAGVRSYSSEPLQVFQNYPPALRYGESSASETNLRLLRATLELSFESDGRSAALVDGNNLLHNVLTDPLNLFKLPRGRPTDDLSRILPGRVLTGLLTARQRLEKGETAAKLVMPTEDKLEYHIELHRLPGHIGGTDLSLLLVRAAEAELSSTANFQSVESSERLESLERELVQAKETLQATIEELQSTNEEQQSTNEELVASNEELQSSNEELQSVNEELITVNTEYHKRNEELLTATADLDNLLSSTAVATLYLNSNLTVRRFTPSTTRVIPLQASDIGRPLSDLSYDLDIDLVQEAEQVLISGEQVEHHVRSHSGTWTLLRLTRYQDARGQGVGVLITMVDVTRIKNAEETARVMSDSLSASNAQLRDQAYQLEDLFSIVAHDLKRPVLSLDGMLELAQRSFKSGQLEQGAAQLEKAASSLATLRNILRDLASLSAQTRADPIIEEVDVPSWLERVLTPFQDRAEEAGVRLQWASEEGALHFCRAAAEGALVNLVENALLHGATDEAPRISILCQQTPNSIKLTVSDNGEGISPKYHGKIFELFRRLDPGKESGSGVGLVAARRLAQRAGGAVTVQSEEGEGARFTIELPLGAATPIQRPSAAPVSGSQVLLVEDDAIDRKRCQRLLGDFDVANTGTLSSAKELCRSRKYSLIVLDLSLPDGHGLGLLPVLGGGVNHSTPVLLLSGHAEGLDPRILQEANVLSVCNKNETDDATLRGIIEQQVG